MFGPKKQSNTAVAEQPVAPAALEELGPADRAEVVQILAERLEQRRLKDLADAEVRRRCAPAMSPEALADAQRRLADTLASNEPAVVARTVGAILDEFAAHMANEDTTGRNIACGMLSRLRDQTWSIVRACTGSGGQEKIAAAVQKRLAAQDN
jgi:hypothetical protein